MPGAVLLHLGHQVSWSAWHFDPVIIAGLFFGAVSYAYGMHELRVRWSWWRTACFYTGMVAVFIALVSPLDAGAERLLSLHMLQHVLITTIGPPLILLGLPIGLLQPLLKWPSLHRAVGLLTMPVFTAGLFIVNMWFWHIPPVYDAALNHIYVHAAMHIAMLLTGILFWWPVIEPMPVPSRLGDGGRLLYLFVSGFPMGLLALLLISSGNVVYDYYEQQGTFWGISAMADQQVAGVIMGALGEAASFVAISLLFFRFLDREAAR